VPRPDIARADSQFERLAVLVDTETTGLQHGRDEARSARSPLRLMTPVVLVMSLACSTACVSRRWPSRPRSPD
jgi:hypothetical protein